MNTIEQIREMLANLANLTPDELADLRSSIVALANETDEGETTPESVQLLQELADAGESVMARQSEVEAAQAQAEADREAARERIARISGSDETPEEDPTVEAEPAAEPAAEPVAVAASGSRVARMASSAPKPAITPEVIPSQARGALLASGDLHGKRNGEEITDEMDLARAMAQTLSRMSPLDRPRGRVLVASASWSELYPAERRFGKDAEANGAIVDAVTAPRALVATGGICSPVNIDYSMDAWATAERPLRDGLPAFEASRGGLTFRTPPDFAALLAGTAVWSEATDANPAGATKPVVSIACPSTTTVYVDAIPTRLGFGNMESRFDPETVAINTQLAMVAAANVAELNLLAKIASASVKSVTTAKVLGAARDFFSTLDGSLAVYRNVHRLPDSQIMTAILPRWVKDIIRIDRIKELAHDAVAVDPFGVSDEWIESQFALRKVKPIWILDNAPAVSPSGGVTAGYPLQGWTGFTADAALPAFPTSTAWYLFPEGSVQFLDGGRLDLGIVRDSTLDATNDYETFVEPFEGIANRGFANSIIQLISTLCANGVSQATKDASSTCA